MTTVLLCKTELIDHITVGDCTLCCRSKGVNVYELLNMIWIDVMYMEILGSKTALWPFDKKKSRKAWHELLPDWNMFAL